MNEWMIEWTWLTIPKIELGLALGRINNTNRKKRKKKKKPNTTKIVLSNKTQS